MPLASAALPPFYEKAVFVKGVTLVTLSTVSTIWFLSHTSISVCKVVCSDVKLGKKALARHPSIRTLDGFFKVPGACWSPPSVSAAISVTDSKSSR